MDFLNSSLYELHLRENKIIKSLADFVHSLNIFLAIKNFCMHASSLNYRHVHYSPVYTRPQSGFNPPVDYPIWIASCLVHSIQKRVNPDSTCIGKWCLCRDLLSRISIGFLYMHPWSDSQLLTVYDTILLTMSFLLTRYVLSQYRLWILYFSYLIWAEAQGRNYSCNRY